MVADQQTGAPRIGVVTFPGTLDHAAVVRALELAGAQAVPLWHTDTDLQGVDAVVLPGGATYGNYLRAGALASLSPIVGEITEAAGNGLPVLGIANGFHILTEAGLLPGSLAINDGVAFHCSEETVTVENTDTAWTRACTRGGEVTLPFKNAHGRFTAPDAELDQLEAAGRVVLRYVGQNPTGADRGIAGVTNEAGNVVGIMVHPEYAVEAGFGTDTGSGNRAGTDGLVFFTSALVARSA